MADYTDWTWCLWSCIAAAAAQVVEERREEERTAALAKLRAHVRTGTYNGTIERRIRGLMREMPRAETLCDGEPTSKDHTLTSAWQTVRDASEPFLSDMCPACRAKLEVGGARDLSNLPARSGSSTVKQRSYLRRLLDEGARSGRPYLVEARGIDQMSSRSASAAIDKLRALKERGWKGDL
jgi:HAMP domain-containing protein